ncbi:MAG: ABC transporter substrate-binding protein [Deltaproteobacteria bacterium]|nr:ABC transporter substrate-binding protein [Deltaproteobacteria bacterium]
MLGIAVANAPETLDPRFATSAVAQRLAALVAAPLVIIGDDLRPEPFLAESIDAVDPLTLVLKLRPGVRFHDGTLVTADDVVFTLGSMKDPALGSPHAARLQHLLELVALDERTVRLRFDAATAPFLVDLHAWGILSRAACSGSRDACRARPMGAGPYRVVQALGADERLLLAAHDASPLPPPAIRQVEVRVIRDNTTRLLELLDGRTQLVQGDLTPTDVAAVAGDPDLAVERARGLGFTYLALNARAGPLADPRVRRALAHALDVDLVIATKLQGMAERASSILPRAHWAHDDALAPPRHDRALAERLLDEAGLPRRGDGTRFSLRLATTTDRLRRATALAWAEMLRAVGVDVRVEVRDWNALYQDIQVGAFDAFSAKWTPVIEPDLLYWVFHSSSIPAPAAEGRAARAGGNRQGTRDPVLDELLERARQSPDSAERAARYRAAEARIADATALVPLWFEDELAIRSRRLQGFTLGRTASFLPIAKARLE